MMNVLFCIYIYILFIIFPSLLIDKIVQLQKKRNEEANMPESLVEKLTHLRTFRVCLFYLIHLTFRSIKIWCMTKKMVRHQATFIIYSFYRSIEMKFSVQCTQCARAYIYIQKPYIINSFVDNR